VSDVKPMLDRLKRNFISKLTLLCRIEKEMEKKRQNLLQRQVDSWETRGIRSSSSALLIDKEELVEQVTKVVVKHYRRASVKVHPDRVAIGFQEDFDALTKARNVLREPELRATYMEQMLEVWCKVGAGYVVSSHSAWVDKHQPDVEDQKKQTAGKKKPVFALQGGLLHDKPGKLGVEVLGLSLCTVRLHSRLPRNNYQFFQYCKSVHVIRLQVNRDNSEEVCLAFLDESKLTSLLRTHEYGDFNVDVVVLQSRVWDICWRFVISIDDITNKTTPRSEEARVDLMSAKQRHHLETLHKFEELARKRTLGIRSVLIKLSGSCAGQGATTNTYSTLQAVVLRGQHTAYLLGKWRNLCGDGSPQSLSSQRLADLEQTLLDTEPYKEKFDKILAVHERKKGVKQFKAKLHDVLESGLGSPWISRIGKDDFTELKGDANRLYQLLIEGKQTHSIELVDTAALDAAVTRTDLFTAKQIETLEKRRDEVEEHATQAAALAMKEAKERVAAEQERRDMEKRGRFMEQGSAVVLQGLKTQQQLNGSLATYMRLGQGDRYVVRLYVDSREVSLQKENFRKWDGGLGGLNLNHSSSGQQRCWQCVACTYLHEGSLATTDKCTICQTPRDPEEEPAKIYRVTEPVLQQKPQKASSEETKTKSPKRNGKKTKCLHGLKCKFLKKGNCRFYHPSEQVDTISAAKPANESKKTHRARLPVETSVAETVPQTAIVEPCLQNANLGDECWNPDT
jgi:hypothetical protein